MRNDCIVDVLIDRVEFLFCRLYDSYLCYMYIDHRFIDINCSPHSFWACWVVLSGPCDATI